MRLKPDYIWKASRRRRRLERRDVFGRIVVIGVVNRDVRVCLVEGLDEFCVGALNEP